MSRTLTVKLQLLLLPLLSLAVLVTVVMPTGKPNPLAGALVIFVTAQLSLARGAVQLTTAVHTPGSV